MNLHGLCLWELRLYMLVVLLQEAAYSGPSSHLWLLFRSTWHLDRVRYARLTTAGEPLRKLPMTFWPPLGSLALSSIRRNCHLLLSICTQTAPKHEEWCLLGCYTVWLL
jgi:hypothetical protein